MWRVLKMWLQLWPLVSNRKNYGRIVFYFILSWIKNRQNNLFLLSRRDFNRGQLRTVKSLSKTSVLQHWTRNKFALQLRMRNATFWFYQENARHWLYCHKRSGSPLLWLCNQNPYAKRVWQFRATCRTTGGQIWSEVGIIYFKEQNSKQYLRPLSSCFFV